VAVHLAGKVLLDTNVMIDYLRTGAHGQWVHGQVKHTVRFLSSVVLMELRLGVDTGPRYGKVDQIRATFPPERVIAPTPASFERAASIFRTLFHPGAEPKDRLGPVNDILIALTARQIGAAIISANAHDFTRIAEHLPGLLVLHPLASG